MAAREIINPKTRAAVTFLSGDGYPPKQASRKPRVRSIPNLTVRLIVNFLEPPRTAILVDETIFSSPRILGFFTQAVFFEAYVGPLHVGQNGIMKRYFTLDQTDSFSPHPQCHYVFINPQTLQLRNPLRSNKSEPTSSTRGRTKSFRPAQSHRHRIRMDFYNN